MDLLDLQSYSREIPHATAAKPDSKRGRHRERPQRSEPVGKVQGVYGSISLLLWCGQTGADYVVSIGQISVSIMKLKVAVKSAMGVKSPKSKIKSRDASPLGLESPVINYNIIPPHQGVIIVPQYIGLKRHLGELQQSWAISPCWG